MAGHPSSSYFPALTGLRAVAAFMVYLSHSQPLRFITDSPVLLSLDFTIGVNIFFVLSGFLITLRYAESATLRASFWRPYLANRFARVYPMWWLLSTIALVWRLGHHGQSTVGTEVRHYLASISFVRGFSSTLLYAQIQQGWTLTVEESFYLLAPVLFVLWRKGKSAAVVFGLAAVGLLAVGSLLVETVGGRFEGFFSDYYLVLCWTIVGRCGEFFAGAGLACWLLRRDAGAQHRGAALTALSIGGILLVLLLVGYARRLQVPEMTVRLVLLQGLLTLPLVGLLYGLLSERTWASRALGSAPAVVLGKASYIFYLIHMGPVHDAIYRGGPAWDTPGRWALDLLGITALSVAAYYWMEAPLNQFFRRRLAGQPVAAAASLHKPA
ncbi:MAG TPA: acyltransferase [Hymenobacter sp.]|jgi:peptidoglycan/LPS O-acetylase OafA/YrhL|uniref:acyltransferase family protein n=1 Tax=Hymenobacter sp. TaxID=1898978 RepID=UPI002ED92420